MSTNLDMACAELGAKLGQKSDDKTLTAALSILEQQGPYAFFLYLKQKEDQASITDACWNFLREHKFFQERQDIFAELKSLAENLDHLLMARDLLRQGLIYGRYHAKAAGRTGEVA